MTYDSTIMSPAMKARLALPIPSEFDIRRSHIQIFDTWSAGEYVKTVHPAAQYQGVDSSPDYYRAAEKQAKSLWKSKYGAEMPEDAKGGRAEVTCVNLVPYDGLTPTDLTDKEWSILTDYDVGDFTLDMLWLMVEGLGWRPGVPVSEDDPGWLVVWAEEEQRGGYLHIIRAVLGMLEAPDFHGWKPAAVIAAYEQATDHLIQEE